jgi:predicted DNA-binding WGR domain protein
MTYQAEVTEVQYQDPNRNANKYYRCYHIWDEETLDHRVLFQWGRLGSKGQCQVNVVEGEGQAATMISGKLRDKTDKGYRVVYDKELPGVSVDLLNLAGVSDAANGRSQRPQDPMKVLLIDIDTCRRLSMGDNSDVTQAVVMRRSLTDQLDALRRSVEEADGQIEIVDMLLGAKLGA